jgi:hypothetical protein
MASDMITQTIVNQHNGFGTWELRRAEILYALLDEFVSMLASDQKCREMEEALSETGTL